jgi:hypothetical protein
MHFYKKTTGNPVTALFTGSLFLYPGSFYGYILYDVDIINCKDHLRGKELSPLPHTCYQTKQGWITFDSLGRIWLLNIPKGVSDVEVERDRTGFLSWMGEPLLAKRLSQAEIELDYLFLQ